MRASEKLKPKVLKTENAESCKAKRSSKSSSSTSLSSSAAFASSSTASIVSLAEGEAATSLVLQDDVLCFRCQG